MHRSLGALFQPLGLVPRRKGKSVLLWGSGPEAFEALEPLRRALVRRNPRLHVRRLTPSAALRARLVRTGGGEVHAPPAPVGPAMRLYLKVSRAQLLVLGDPPDAAAARFVECAAGLGVPVAALGDARSGADAGGWRSRVDLWIPADRAGADSVSDAVRGLTLLQRKPGGVSRRLRDRWVPALLGSPLVRWKYRSIATLEELRGELGRPEAILCLGNGPSSEDPRLRDVSFDALFRVNHVWQSRGFLTRPQMVFTGRRASVAAVRGPVLFGFQTREEEQKLLLKCLLLPRRIRFATAERLGLMDFGSFGAFQPTNGAVMLAAAVALQPRRLIVAGIDLFQHPAGSYPGDTRTPNAYGVFHDRDSELDFVLDRLEHYRGALTLYGEVLEGHWRARCARRAERPRH